MNFPLSSTLRRPTAWGVFLLLFSLTRQTAFAQSPLPDDFNPGADGRVRSLAVQPDGKILVSGMFETLGGQPRDFLGRLNADGTLDTTFHPGADGWVNSLVVQTDGKILVGGEFSTLGGQPCNFLGRLNADGTLDLTFNPGRGGSEYFIVHSLAVQADGRILVGGSFSALSGQPHDTLGRLNNTVPATHSLAYDGTTITWLRGGASPEVWWTTLESSLNGVAWTELGTGTRISGGWQLTGVSLPPDGVLRARGYVSNGRRSWFVEDYWGTSGGSLVLSIELLGSQTGGEPQVRLTYPVASGFEHRLEFCEPLGGQTSWQTWANPPHNSGAVTIPVSEENRFFRVQRIQSE